LAAFKRTTTYCR